MARNPKSGIPQKGSTTRLQTVLKDTDSAIDTRKPPCGKNQLTPDDAG